MIREDEYTEAERESEFFSSLPFANPFPNDILEKAEILHEHEDDPYFVWYSERNFHMIMTEEGWKFDVFQLWY